VHVCVFVSVWILYFFVFLGRDKDNHHSFTIFLSKQNFTKFSSSLAVAFLLLLDVLQYLLLWVCLFCIFKSLHETGYETWYCTVTSYH
jgi:hypothetical protein